MHAHPRTLNATLSAICALHGLHISLLVLFFIPFLFVFLWIRQPPSSPLFPYTTLFRSHTVQACRQRHRYQRAHNAGNDDARGNGDRKSTRLNSSHVSISYAVFCLKKKKEYATD